MARTVKLDHRIAKFIARLESVDKDRRIRTVAGRHKAIERVCNDEMAYWRDWLGIEAVRDESGLTQSVKGSVATFHSYLTDIRTAVRESFDGRLNQFNSYTQEVGAIGKRRLETRHVALKFLIKSSVEKQARSEAQSSAVYLKLSSRESVSRSEVLEVAKDLLKRNSYISLALGVAAVTGRRMVEVFYRGRFEVTGEYEVLFSGQTKTKADDPLDTYNNPYKIPTLIPAADVVEAVNRLRAKKDFSSLEFVFGELPEQKRWNEVNRAIAQQTASEVHAQVKRHFYGVIKNPQAKSLRAIYAQTLWDRNGGQNSDQPNQAQLVFFANLLGHSEGDYLTAASYLTFVTTP